VAALTDAAYLAMGRFTLWLGRQPADGAV